MHIFSDDILRQLILMSMTSDLNGHSFKSSQLQQNSSRNKKYPIKTTLSESSRYPLSIFIYQPGASFDGGKFWSGEPNVGTEYKAMAQILKEKTTFVWILALSASLYFSHFNQAQCCVVPHTKGKCMQR